MMKRYPDKKILFLLILLIGAVVSGGGCIGGGGSGSVDEGNVPRMLEVNIKDFAPADWKDQEWQRASEPEGEIHPYLPFRFNLTVETNRQSLNNEDSLWVALSFIEEMPTQSIAKLGALRGSEFDSPETEPTDDPLYLGFFIVQMSEGEHVISGEILPQSGVAAGDYVGIRAEAFIPGELGEVVGQSVFDWYGDVSMLDRSKVAPIHNYWSEITIDADPPRAAGNTDGFDTSDTAVVDVISGFQRLFEGDTPLTRTNASDVAVGYYAEVTTSQKILAATGIVSHIVVTESNGLHFWNEATGQFEPTYKWEGTHASKVDLVNETVTYSPGFRVGDNGLTVIVGKAGGEKPTIKLPDIHFTFVAYDQNGQQMGSSVEASDETIRITRARSDAARGENGFPAFNIEYPFVLQDNGRRVNIPLTEANRRLDYDRNTFIWSEEMLNTDQWEKLLSANVDYVGWGTRTIYTSDKGDIDDFAARFYVMFEEYGGLAHALPPSTAAYAIHDVMSMSGVRASVGVTTWIAARRYDLATLGAEFRTHLRGKTASKWDGADRKNPYTLVDETHQKSYSKLGSSGAEFNIELKGLGVTLLTFPLEVEGVEKLLPKYESIRLIKLPIEAKAEVTLYAIQAQLGMKAEVYVDLKLTAKLKQQTYGVEGTGRFTIAPGADVKGFIEAGVGCSLLGATVGLEMRFLDYNVGSGIALDGVMEWRDTAQGPVVKANWATSPAVDLYLATLDGELYTAANVGPIEGKIVIFAWKGLSFNIPLWKGSPITQTEGELPLRRRPE